MPLFADRFITHASFDHRSGGPALDLATRHRVRIVKAAAGSATEQRNWLVECGDCLRVRPFAAPRLLDYGRVGETHRFEAWVDGPRRQSAAGQTAIMAGINVIDRPAAAAFATLFDTVDDRRLRVAACWGPAGSGRSTIVEQLARIARIRGFVPIDTVFLDSYIALVTGRTLFMVDRQDSTTASAWLRAVLRVPRPHICVIVRSDEVRGVDGFGLDRIAPATLAAAIVEPAPDQVSRRRLLRAAEAARGLPGRFVRTLRPDLCDGEAASRPSALPRVAEQAAPYDVEPAVEGLLPQAGRAVRQPHVWPAPGELAALRRRAAAATALIDGGKAAPGVRALRQVMAALARRDAWTDASQCAFILATALLERGRPRDARRVLDDAAGWVARASDPGALIDVAVLAGSAWTDLARLDEAERVLSGAVSAARADGDAQRISAATTGLARCLFWRGQYAEAVASLEATNEAGDDRSRVRRQRTLARAAAAQGDVGKAMAALETARNIASDCAGARWLPDVDYTAAWISLSLGDMDGVDRTASACAAGARSARRPMRVVGARLLQAEADRRRGKEKDAVAWAALRRLAAAGPPLVRTRFDLLRAVVQAPDDDAVLRRHISAAGLRGLEMFVRGVPRISGPAVTEPFVDDVLGILRICQHADDELSVLADVCGRVRERLHAATSAFVVVADRRFDTLIAEGPRMDAADIAERAITARLTIAPHRVRERLDAAAPVYSGGDVIGALCARWTVGTSYDLSHAPTVLTMAAAAAAPVLSSLLVKRAQASQIQPTDLLGVTPAIAELRQAIEKAAAAPFPVLIEGESGCGKELVAKAVHRCGPRRHRAFATLNCAALPDDLVEAELFGHVRGSFTGAVCDRPGVFEEAHGGTLFLDEIGELSLRAQAKLLRVIQEGELRRIGENLSRRVDVRIVCATNRNLRDETEAGRFRQDLLYRLDVVRINVPALRDRREDVAVLVEHFWNEATRRVASRATLAADTRAALSGYDWPGNVRELQNVLAALAVRSPKRGVVLPAALPAHMAAVERPASWHLESAKRSFETEFVRAALTRCGGQRTRAAAELGVTRQGLTKLMARLGIE